MTVKQANDIAKITCNLVVIRRRNQKMNMLVGHLGLMFLYETINNEI